LIENPASPPPGRTGFDARRTLAIPAAVAAFEGLGARLRELHYRSGRSLDEAASAIEVLASGNPAARDGVAEAVGDDGLDALAAAGAVALLPETVEPLFVVLAGGTMLTVVPLQDREDAAYVYLGPDSQWLLERAWSYAKGGRVAVDLGTGTGYIAVALAPRYELTIGVDLLPSVAALAALTFRLNAGFAGRMAACACDVASALRPGCADLVVANAPWVPSRSITTGADRRIWADGGVDGLELPTRFIHGAASLLASGGTAIVQCIDPRFESSRPLEKVAAGLVAEGFVADIRPVGPPELSDTLTERFAAPGGPTEIHLVDVVVERHD